MKRVFLADPDMAVRSAMALLLKHKLGIQSVYEIADAAQLSERMAHSQPDLLLVDWELPGLVFPQMLSQARSRRKRPSVIVMSVKAENETGVLASGADGFINKQAPAENVVNLLRQHLRA